MPRKRWTPKSEDQITPEVLRFREKRKWQIALRRYVLQDHPSAFYAPYFGLDIKTLRKWFQMQFSEGMNWENFGEEWQFDHVIPVSYFDFAEEAELKMCWNFVNLRIEPILPSKHKAHRVDVLASKAYFRKLYDQTQYLPCLHLLQKVEKIENAELLGAEDQLSFIKEHQKYLEALASYSSFEFELLNKGRSIDEVTKEIEMMKKLKY
jgi:hypothetical protein